MNRVERIQEMLQSNPKDNFLRHALALEYIKLQNDSEAQKWFEAVLHDSPDYVGSYYHLAKLFERNGQTDLAITWYEKGMQMAKQLNQQHAFNELRAAYDECMDT